MLTTARLLARDAAVLWWRRLPWLGGWFCLGYAGRLLGEHLSTVLGANRLPATLAFIAGVVCWLAGLALMVHSLEPALPGLRGRDDLATGQSGLDALADGLGPFMAVFSLWGLVEDRFRALFSANLATHGLDATDYSVNLSDWPFYTALAAGAWLVSRGLRLVPGRLAKLLGTAADGTFVFAVFVVVRQLTILGLDWLSGRAVWRWGETAVAAVVDALPAWPWLPLPELVRRSLSWLAGTGPAALGAALLPLLWVSLCAVVFGWREFTARGLATGTRAERLAARLADGEDASGPLWRLWLWLSADYRDKYLPAAHGLRLVARQGWGFVGALIGLAAVVQLVGVWLERAVVGWIGPQSLAVTVGYQPVLGLFVELFATTIAVALYATAFDHGLRAGSRSPSPVG